MGAMSDGERSLKRHAAAFLKARAALEADMAAKHNEGMSLRAIASLTPYSHAGVRKVITRVAERSKPDAWQSPSGGA